MKIFVQILRKIHFSGTEKGPKNMFRGSTQFFGQCPKSSQFFLPWSSLSHAIVSSCSRKALMLAGNEEASPPSCSFNLDLTTCEHFVTSIGNQQAHSTTLIFISQKWLLTLMYHFQHLNYLSFDPGSP